ncbi:MAG: DUF883 family protein [Phycisphaerales bacterium]
MSSATSSTSGPSDLGLKDNVRRLGDDVQQLKQDLAGTARSGAAAAKDTLKQGLSTAKEKGAEATEAVRGHITSNPFAAVGIAAGVGFLLGMLVSRSRS